MAEPEIYLEKLSAFSRMLRLEGLPISPKETEDAARLLISLGMADRTQVKTALRTVYAKSREEQLSFDRCFDGFFLTEEQMRQQAEAARQRQQELEQHRQEAQEELQLNGQPMDLSDTQREVYAAMPEESRQRLRNFMDKYRGTAERNPKLYGEFIHSVFTRTLLEQQMLLENAGMGAQEADPEIGILYRDISQFKDTEIPKAIELIQAVARQINGELAAKRQRGGHTGQLDFRRTIRKGLQTGGSLNRLAYKRRRAHRRQLVMLCDVSGSMVQFSEFALRFIQSLNQVSDSSRTFLFFGVHGGGGCLPAAKYGFVPGLCARQRHLWPGHGFGVGPGAAVRPAAPGAGQQHHAADPHRRKVHRLRPGGGGYAGGQAPLRTGTVPESHPGKQVVLPAKCPDPGPGVPHGAVQHPAGTGSGLPQADPELKPDALCNKKQKTGAVHSMDGMYCSRYFCRGDVIGRGQRDRIGRFLG